MLKANKKAIKRINKLNIPPINGIKANKTIIGKKNINIPKYIIQNPTIRKLHVLALFY